MTLTSRKRHAFPARYARKDARRAIYSALFHNESTRDTQPRDRQPASTADDLAHAKAIFKLHREQAAFPPATLARIGRILNLTAKELGA